MAYFAPVADSLGLSNNLEELARQRDLSQKNPWPARSHIGKDVNPTTPKVG